MSILDDDQPKHETSLLFQEYAQNLVEQCCVTSDTQIQIQPPVNNVVHCSEKVEIRDRKHEILTSGEASSTSKDILSYGRHPISSPDKLVTNLT